MSDDNIVVKFSKEFMIDDVLGNEDVVVLNEITGTSRWNIHHHLIFKHEGKFYETHYIVGATELQEEGPWEYEDEVRCVEVEPYERTVVDYRPVRRS